MSKVYKIKDKLVVYLPFEVVGALGINEGDDIDFIKKDNYFLFAKKSYIADVLAGRAAPGSTAKPVYVGRQQAAQGRAPDENELKVLKKLDTIRYNNRTGQKVGSMLNADEKKTLQDLIKKKFVMLYKKDGEQDYKYTIPKYIYDNFLFGKRNAVVPSPQMAEAAAPEAQQQKKWEQKLDESGDYIKMLDARGYLVMATETEAAAASSSLEESIRRGLVVGTRAFNKKFYIVTKGFIAKSLPKINKVIGQKGVNVATISKETGIDEDGIRAVLYVMAENGDVTEVRKDVFKTA